MTLLMIDKLEIPCLKLSPPYVAISNLRNIQTFMMFSFPVLICFPSKICMFVYTEEAVGNLIHQCFMNI